MYTIVCEVKARVYLMHLDSADRIELADLLAAYARGVDDRLPADKMQELFTDDAVIEGPWGSHQGIEGVRAWVEAGRAHADLQFRHLISNTVARPGAVPDEAEISAYFVQYATDAPKDGASPTPPRLVYVGVYDCAARRVKGAWRLCRRVVRPDGV